MSTNKNQKDQNPKSQPRSGSQPKSGTQENQTKKTNRGLGSEDEDLQRRVSTEKQSGGRSDMQDDEQMERGNEQSTQRGKGNGKGRSGGSL